MHSSHKKQGTASKTKRDTLRTPYLTSSGSKKSSSFLEGSKADKAKYNADIGEKVIGKSSSSGQFKERPIAGKSKFTNETSSKGFRHKQYLPPTTTKEETNYTLGSSITRDYATKKSYYADTEKEAKKFTGDFFNMGPDLDKDDFLPMEDTWSPSGGIKPCTTFKVRKMPSIEASYGSTSVGTTGYNTRSKMFDTKEDQKNELELTRSYSSYYGEEGERENCKS